MGQEIETASFTDADFKRFSDRLKQETDHLRRLFDEKAFADEHEVAGFELEAWLVDRKTSPAPVNEHFLETLADPMVVHELSRFNIELNSTPQVLKGNALGLLAEELDLRWQRCQKTASEMDVRLAMTGILPVIREQELTLANMSAVKRYKALNEQVLNMRKGAPLKLSIRGHEHLQTEHHDVMLESAATSFQVHIQVRPDLAARYFNASCLISAPIIAVAANSPFLFGKDLWDETRIPLFEQSVNTNEAGSPTRTGRSRVTFGHGYLDASLMELFDENVELYPVLLPELHPQEIEQLYHLRLHNGTIWRWNRPLIGVDEKGMHLRIEHRVIPAGPTIIDMMANAALFYGLVHAHAHLPAPIEVQQTFDSVRQDFYRAARFGLSAEIHWPGRGVVHVRDLLLDHLIPMAGEGLAALGISDDDINRFLQVIAGRAESGQTGSAWQRQHRLLHKSSFHEMTEAYLANQQQGLPVHEWVI